LCLPSGITITRSGNKRHDRRGKEENSGKEAEKKKELVAEREGGAEL
jgi:hypothetical protein